MVTVRGRVGAKLDVLAYILRFPPSVSGNSGHTALADLIFGVAIRGRLPGSASR
jgi:hypothetical protein